MCSDWSKGLIVQMPQSLASIAPKAERETEIMSCHQLKRLFVLSNNQM